MAGAHQDFWRKHPGLVWSNPEADDAAHIGAALLRPRFDRLLDIALEFGLERLRHEWGLLLEEDTSQARRARPWVERILKNIGEGLSRAASWDSNSAIIVKLYVQEAKENRGNPFGSPHRNYCEKLIDT
jgi:hypothetical protein